MKFVNYATYIDDQSKISRVRPAHIAYLQTVYASGNLVASGPFTDGSGGLFIYEVADLSEAEALIAGDPFCTEGVFATTKITPWRLLAVNQNLLKPELPT